MFIYSMKEGGEGIVGGMTIPEEGYTSKYRLPQLEQFVLEGKLNSKFAADPLPRTKGEGMSLEEKSRLEVEGKIHRVGMGELGKSAEKAGRPHGKPGANVPGLRSGKQVVIPKGMVIPGFRPGAKLPPGMQAKILQIQRKNFGGKKKR